MSAVQIEHSIEREEDKTPENTGESQSDFIPSVLPAGEVKHVALSDGEEVLVIGASIGRFRKGTPGLPVIISPDDWECLQRWKYTRLLIVSGQVRASDGSKSRPLVARLLTNTTYGANVSVHYRNGNALDLRRSNIAVIPNGVLLGAERIKSEPTERSDTVTLRDGRVRTRRKPQVPNAVERLEALLQNDKKNDGG